MHSARKVYSDLTMETCFEEKYSFQQAEEARNYVAKQFSKESSNVDFISLDKISCEQDMTARICNCSSNDVQPRNVIQMFEETMQRHYAQPALLASYDRKVQVFFLFFIRCLKFYLE